MTSSVRIEHEELAMEPDAPIMAPAAATTVPEFIRAIAAAHGTKIAITADDASITYAELEQQSALLACGLLARGVGKGTRVGLLLANHPRWAVAWAAICRVGAVCVPLSTLSRPAELARLVLHGDLAGLIAQEHVLSQDFTELLPRALPSLGDTDRLVLHEAPYLRWIAFFGDDAPSWATTVDELRREGDEAEINGDLLAVVEREVHIDDDAMIIYTSGQSAEPKGVLHSQASVMRKTHYLSEMLNMGPDTEYNATLPFFWVGGLVMGLFTTLVAGGVVHCTDRTGGSGTVIGAPVTAPNPYPDALLAPALGMSETFGMYSWGNEWRVPGHLICAPLDVFQPGFEVNVVDPDGRPVSDGEQGEIVLRGPTLLTRLNKVDKRTTFDADGFYHTGDEGLAEGERIHFLGRLGDMIKSSGANVAPAEVERELTAVPGVKSAYVVGVRDAKRGQVVAGVLVPDGAAVLDLDEIRATLKDRLSSYKVPRYLVVIDEEDVPTTPSLKVRKPALRELIERSIRD
jgi:acyl-CoA synthetase (AMP-forming)/AMP-acid ligase II